MAQQQIPVEMDVFADRYGSDLTQRPVLMGVHPSDIGFILGKSGGTIKKIEKEVGATITFVPYTLTFPNVPPHFTIMGNQNATMNAFSQLSALANESLRRQWMKSAKTSEVTNTLKIKRDDMKMVIGKGGHTIQSINKRYNVRSFTRTDDKDPKDTSVIDITGYGPDVAAAKKHIWNIVHESMRRRGVQIDVDEMFTMAGAKIDKKQEDDAIVEKMTKLYYLDDLKSQDEWCRLRDLLSTTDKPLLKRVDDTIQADRKKRKDDAIVEKMTKLYYLSDQKSKDEWCRLRELLRTTDKPLLKRVDDTIQAELDSVGPYN